MLKNFLLSAVLYFSFTSVTSAQTTPMAVSGDVGIAASLQDEQLDVILPIWVADNFVLAPALGFVMAEDFGTDLSIAAMARYYFRKSQVSTYIGPKIGAILFSPESGSSTTDLLVGAMLGGEFFLASQFSLGVEVQLNAFFADDASTRFGNPGKMTINTGSAVYATMYF
jgi:hypothetical protein